MPHPIICPLRFLYPIHFKPLHMNRASQPLLPPNKTLLPSSAMILLKQLNPCYQMPPLPLLNPHTLLRPTGILRQGKVLKNRRRMMVKASQEEEEKGQRRSFLSLEEAGLVEISGLSTHERFLCRLTISSLNLLRVISEQEGFPIEELNAGRICDWFLKDKLKREQDLGSAVLQWDDSDFQI